jgi:hypothetical protein
MYYRYDADDLMYEIVNDKEQVLCKVNTEEEAIKVLKERK